MTEINEVEIAELRAFQPMNELALENNADPLPFFLPRHRHFSPFAGPGELYPA